MINDIYSATSRPISAAATPRDAQVAAGQTALPTERIARQDVAAVGRDLPPEQVSDVKPEASAVDINGTVEKLREHVKSLDRELEFSVDEDSGRTVITVRDPETDEVLRQIPPDELLYVVKALQENSASLFVEAKA